MARERDALVKIYRQLWEQPPGVSREVDGARTVEGGPGAEPAILHKSACATLVTLPRFDFEQLRVIRWLAPLPGPGRWQAEARRLVALAEAAATTRRLPQSWAWFDETLAEGREALLGAGVPQDIPSVPTLPRLEAALGLEWSELRTLGAEPWPFLNEVLPGDAEDWIFERAKALLQREEALSRLQWAWANSWLVVLVRSAHREGRAPWVSEHLKQLLERVPLERLCLEVLVAAVWLVRQPGDLSSMIQAWRTRMEAGHDGVMEDAEEDALCSDAQGNEADVGSESPDGTSVSAAMSTASHEGAIEEDSVLTIGSVAPASPRPSSAPNLAPTTEGRRHARSEAPAAAVTSNGQPVAASTAEPETPQENAPAKRRPSGFPAPDIEAQIEELSRVVSANPDDIAARTMLHGALRGAGRWHALMKSLEDQLTRLEAGRAGADVGHQAHEGDAVSAPDAAETAEGVDAATTDPGGVQARLAVLAEMVEVYADVLSLPAMVIQTLQRMIRIDPQNEEALFRLKDAYADAKRWADLIEVNETLAERLSGERNVALRLESARLWIERFANFQKAAKLLEALQSEGVANREVLDTLAELYRRRRAYGQLLRCIEALIPLVGSDLEARATLHREAADILGRQQRQPAEALPHLKEIYRCGVDPDGTLGDIERVAERLRDYATLSWVYEEQVERCTDAVMRSRIRQKHAALLEDKLENSERAFALWELILAENPGDARALRVLRRAYASQGRWEDLEALYAASGDFEGLAEVLGRAAEQSGDPEVQVRLSLRVAAVYADELAQPERAFRAYERVLTLDPHHREALQALQPIYRAQQKWPRLRQILEVDFELACGAGDLVRAEQLAAELLELYLGRSPSPNAAFSLIERLIARGLGQATHIALIADLARELEASERGLAMLDELFVSLDAAARPGVLRAGMKLAASARLSERVAMLGWRLVELGVADAADLVVLEEAIVALGEHEPLRRLYQHRVQEAQGDARALALNELAILERDVLEDPLRALASFRELFDSDPLNEDWFNAARTLAESLGEWAVVESLLRQRLDSADGDLSAQRASLDLAALLAHHGGEIEEAVTLARAVAFVDGRHVDGAESSLQAEASALLERLLEPLHERPALRLELLLELEGHARASADLPAVARLLELRATIDESRVSLDALLELAELQSEVLGKRAEAFATLAAAFRQHPDAERIWDALERSARMAGTMPRLFQLYLGVLEAPDPTLSDGQSALLWERLARAAATDADGDTLAFKAWWQVFERDPEHDRAYRSLKDTLTSREDWEQLESLHRVRITRAVSSEVIDHSFRELAFLLEELRLQPQRALELWQARVLDVPDDSAARQQVRRLLEVTEQWQALDTFLSAELDTEHASAQRAKLLHSLVELRLARLSQVDGALDCLEALLEQNVSDLVAQERIEALLSDPSAGMRAARILEPIYESQGAWQNLVRVLRICLMDAEDSALRLATGQRLGELYLDHLEEPALALSLVRELLPEAAEHTELMEQGFRAAQHTEQLDVWVTTLYQAALEAEAPLAAALLRQGATSALRANLELAKVAGLVSDVLNVWEREPDLADSVAVRCAAQAATTLPCEPLTVRALLVIEQGGLPDNDRVEASLRLAAHFEALGDFASARQHLIQASETAPQLGHVWERLAKASEAVNDAQGQLDALNHALDLEQDPTALEALYLEAASVAAQGLGDTERAATLLEGGVMRLGVAGRIVDTWVRFLRQLEAWDRIAQALEGAVLSGADSEQTERWTFELALIEGERLEQWERAVERLAQLILDNSLEAEGARRALQAWLTKRDAAEASLAAARSIVATPQLLEGAAMQVRALHLVGSASEGSDAVNAFERALDLYELDLGDLDSAQGSVAESMCLEAAEKALFHPRFSNIIERALRLLTDRDAQNQLLDIVLRGVGDIQIPDTLVRVVDTFAGVAEALKRLDAARTLLEHGLSVAPEAEVLHTHLSAVLRQLGDFSSLAELWVARSETCELDSERSRYLLEAALLFEDQAAEPPRAVEAIERAAEAQCTDDVSIALRRIFAKAGEVQRLGAFLEQRIDAGTASTVEQLEYADLALGAFSNAPRAMQVFEGLLKSDASVHDNILRRLVPLLERGDVQVDAGRLLERLARARGAWTEVKEALNAQSASEDLQVRAEALRHLAEVNEEHLDDLDGALAAYIELLECDADVVSVVERISRLGRLLERWGDLATCLERALDLLPDPSAQEATDIAHELAALLAGPAAQPGQARAVYERIRAARPEDKRAFHGLESLLEGAEDWASLVDLYLDAVAMEESADAKLQRYRQAAKLEGEARGNWLRAAEITRSAALDLALPLPWEELAALIQRGGHAPELIELYDELADVTRTPVPGRVDEFSVLAAKLTYESLQDGPGAVARLAEVLRNNPSQVQALGMLETLVQVPELTPQVLEVLDPVYAELGEWKKRIAVLEARAQAERDVFAQAELLQEVARLFVDEQGAGLAALDALRRAAVAAPEDEGVAARFIEVAEAFQLRKEGAQILADLAVESPGALSAPRLLQASVWAVRALGDPAAALPWLERVVELDPEPLAALDLLIEVCTEVKDAGKLADVLGKRAEFEVDIARAAAFLLAQGTVLYRDLERLDDAARALERAADTDPESEAPLKLAADIYEQKGDYRAWLGCMERLEGIADGPEARAAVAFQMAVVCERQLQDVPAAEQHYRRAAADLPGVSAPLQSLRVLLRAREDWSELDNVARELLATCALEQEEQVELWEELGSLHLNGLSQPLEALDAFKQAIQVNPRSALALGGLEQLTLDVEVGPDALEVLRAHFQQLEDWEALVRVQVGVLEACSEWEKRLALVWAVAETHEHARNSPSDAFACLARFGRTDAFSPALRREFERLATVLGEFETALEVLGAQASRDDLGDEVAATLVGIAELMRQQGAPAAAAEPVLRRLASGVWVPPSLHETVDDLIRHSGQLDILCPWLRVQLDTVADAETEQRLRCDLAEALRRCATEGESKAGGVVDESPLEVLEPALLLGGSTSPAGRLLSRWALEYDSGLARAAAQMLASQIEVEGADVLAFWHQWLEGAPEALAGEGVQAYLSAAERDGNPHALVDAARRALIHDVTDARALRIITELPRELAGPALRDFVRFSSQAELSESPLALEVAAHLVRLGATGPEVAAFSVALLACEPGALAALRLRAAVLDALGESAAVQLPVLERLAEACSDDDEACLHLRSVVELGVNAERWESVENAARALLARDDGEVEAQDALSLALEQQQKWQALAAHLEAVLERTFDPDKRAPLRLKLARVSFARLGHSAQTSAKGLVEGLIDEPSNSEYLALIEEMHQRDPIVPTLAEALELALSVATPERADILERRLASLLAESGHEPERAAELLQRLAADAPDDAELFSQLLQVLQRQGDDARLAEVVESRLAQESRPDLRAVSLAYLGELSAPRDPHRAEDFFTQALAEDAQSVRAIEGLLRLRSDQGDWAGMAALVPTWLATHSVAESGAMRRLDAALLATAMHEVAVVAAPETAEAIYIAALAQGHAKNAALESLEALYRKTQQSEALVSLFRRQAEASPSREEALDWQAKLAAYQLNTLGDASGAAHTLDAAAAAGPLPEALEDLWLDALTQSGKAEEAVVVIRRKLERPKPPRGKEGSELYLRLARGLLALEAVEDAKDAYDHAFRLNLSNLEALKELGQLAYETGDHERAQKCFKSLLLQKLTPSLGLTKADIYYCLGDIAAKLGDASRGVSMLERALGEEAGHPKAAALLASLRA